MISYKNNHETLAASIRRVIKITTAASILIFAVSACEKKGPVEKAGESVDEAVEDAGDAIEDAGDKVQRETSK